MKKNSTKLAIALLFALFINCIPVAAQNGAPSRFPANLNEANFFSDNSGTIPQDRRKVLANNGSADDSGNLNNLITNLSNRGGGVITIPRGTWLFGDIKLKSNVHLLINGGAVIKPKLLRSGDNSIFEIGYRGYKVSNVSIRSTSGKFKIDMSGVPFNSRILPFNVKEVENFMISGCHIIDKWSVHSTVNLGLSPRNGVWAGAKKGLIKNISVINAHGGYGAVQVRVGEKIFFKNIASYGGGATLRIETDGRETSGNQAPQNIARVSQISAYNIECKNGNSAVMIQPWGAQNGWFDVQKVKATSCMAAVRIDRAFVALNAPSIGKFNPNSRITDISSTYGTNAQVKDGNIPFVPCSLRTNPNILKTTSKPGQARWFQGPSLAPLWYSASSETGQDPRYYSIKIPSLSNLKQNGKNFPANTPTILRWNHRVQNCANNGSANVLNVMDDSAELKIENKAFIYPNPCKGNYTTLKLENLKEEQTSYFTILNMSGNVVLPKQEFKGSSTKISTSNLPKGVYLVKIENIEGTKTIKLILAE